MFGITIGTANGPRRRGPRVTSVSTAWVKVSTPPNAVPVTTPTRSGCGSHVEPGHVHRFQCRYHRELCETVHPAGLLAVDPVFRPEIDHLGGESSHRSPVESNRVIVRNPRTFVAIAVLRSSAACPKCRNRAVSGYRDRRLPSSVPRAFTTAGPVAPRTSETLCPPNPIELDIANRISPGRATFGNGVERAVGIRRFLVDRRGQQVRVHRRNRDQGFQ